MKGIGAFLDCGRIIGGRCNGDTFVTVITTNTNDPFVCYSDGGLNAQIGVTGFLQVYGDCPSRCQLKSSIIQYDPAFNINGCVGS